MEGSYLTDIDILLETYVTPSWIDEKYNNFKQLKGYDEQEDKVIIKNFDISKTLDDKEPFIFETFLDDDTGKEYKSEIENIIKEEPIEIQSTIITLSDFCWCSDPEKESFQSFDYINSKINFDLQDLMYHVVKNLKDETDGCEKISAYNIIQKATSQIQAFFLRTILIKEFKDSIELMLNLNTICANFIRFQFSSIYKNHINNFQNNDTLDFFLNRNQLAGLIHLLLETELLEPLGKKTKNRPGKYDFFIKYFRWFDFDTNEFKKFTHLSTEIDKIKTSERAKGFHTVYKSISKTYNRLTNSLPKR